MIIYSLILFGERDAFILRETGPLCGAPFSLKVVVIVAGVRGKNMLTLLQAAP